MLILRSLAFNIAFYANLIVWLIAALPTLVLPRRAIMAVVRGWAKTNQLLLRAIAGIKVEMRGLEKIPSGGCLVAAKHQSFWETFALFPLFADPSFIMKRELGFIPLFGWFALKAQMITVDRGARSAALRSMAEQARQQTAAGRQILIFPEGTRRAPGEPPAYKYGVVHLYSELKVPCLPIALNSGVFWPRRRFLRQPGTIVVEVLEPIAPGLDKGDFLERLVREIEGASNRLLEETRQASAR